ncbi:MAG TPA: cupin domain-containing protein [Gaiellaceae bacterium]|nr:cupin domain-containing protein [Gaiellaceae bacterium]
MNEAPLQDHGSGLRPEAEGWFVVNVRDTEWVTTEGGEKRPTGSDCSFESGAYEFEQLGFRIHVLPPGEPNGLYHAESKQEDFLVLHGECLLLVEGEERRLRQWDFVHCPPGTEHIFVGAGDGPCAILMVGARGEDGTILYPVSEFAARHDASVAVETTKPSEAYSAGFEPGRRGRPPYWDELPWAEE